jgi:hypothetical protein
MTREEFIKNIKIDDGTIDGGPLRFHVVQQSTMNAFNDKENFILISPRQSGRMTAIMVNILFELYNEECQHTMLTTWSVRGNLDIFNRLSWLLEKNTFIDGVTITKSRIKNRVGQFVEIKTFGALSKLTLEERKNKRLIILYGAYIDDKTPLFNLIQGWDRVIIETIAGTKDSFNSLFMMNLIDFKGVGVFRVIKHLWNEIFDEEWYNRHKEMFGSGQSVHFSREVMLEWA